jgi:hypothetical protein
MGRKILFGVFETKQAALDVARKMIFERKDIEGFSVTDTSLLMKPPLTFSEAMEKSQCKGLNCEPCLDCTLSTCCSIKCIGCKLPVYFECIIEDIPYFFQCPHCGKHQTS